MAEPPSSDAPESELFAYLASSYPHNHDYRVKSGALHPRFKLWRRWRRIRHSYPRKLTSLLDLSSSKGFFVLEAAGREACRRALGIDVFEPDIAVGRRVATLMGVEGARFERLRLHELAERIEEFGGAFQTVLLINTYPYLYFGSYREREAYGDHKRLFELIARVTSERLLFSNRVELAALPPHLKQMAAEKGMERGYDEASILSAAERFFRVERRGRLGRIPYWVLKPRG